MAKETQSDRLGEDGKGAVNGKRSYEGTCLF